MFRQVVSVKTLQFIETRINFSWCSQFWESCNFSDFKISYFIISLKLVEWFLSLGKKGSETEEFQPFREQCFKIPTMIPRKNLFRDVTFPAKSKNSWKVEKKWHLKDFQISVF